MPNLTVLSIAFLALGAFSSPVQAGDGGDAEPATTMLVKVLDGCSIMAGKVGDMEIEVERGQTLTVELRDCKDTAAYGMIVPADGSTPQPWRRVIGGASSQESFGDADEVRSVVIMAEKGSAKSVTYGPVITVKPKG